MNNHNNRAFPDFPIHDLIAQRWSPDEFDEKQVPVSDLLSLFEAARWAPSSYNEQPWSYIVATKNDPAEFQKMLSCLVESNQNWAKTAPVLVLAVVNKKFIRNGKDNRAAVHDLGLASANLVFEATSRGLSVHQMIGILSDKAREMYGVPDDSEVYTALAIGYASPLKSDHQERKRKKLKEFVFSKNWGNPSAI